tara:strand:+ start:966 stop:1982 length:1017 start_codon:yes stop_codon:yes gene_type:complete
MAFLDNSGDIILDAVLTDVGRQKLSDGKFEITKFGLGDDEINYGTYDLNHPSGSAYYDLEIMQTPVLEAWTATNQNINYGLLTNTNLELEYLPVLVCNEKADCSVSLSRRNNLFYVATNSDTWATLNGTYSDNLLLANSTSLTQYIIVESGLDTYDEPATAVTRRGFLEVNDLIDTMFTVNADSRFIVGVGTIKSGPGGGTFANVVSDNSPNFSIAIEINTSIGDSTELEGFERFRSKGLANRVFDPTSGDGDIYSSLKGPRGSICALNVSIKSSLTSTSQTDRLFQEHGSVNVTPTAAGVPSGTATTYDFLDTILYVQGMFSGATLQIPLRLIRKNS